MIYNVDVEGYTRRLEVQRHGQAFKVSIDERQQVVEASMVDGVWSLPLLDQKGSRQQSFTIVVVERTGPLPRGYPRRPGEPARSPIGVAIP